MSARLLYAAAIVAGLAVIPPTATRAELGLWAVATDTCTPDGRKCIHGVVREGAPYTSQVACQHAAQALLRRYHAANLRVSYIGCVQVQ